MARGGRRWTEKPGTEGLNRDGRDESEITVNSVISDVLNNFHFLFGGLRLPFCLTASWTLLWKRNSYYSG